eukprot:4607018-Prymnesium_polylepis.1
MLPAHARRRVCGWVPTSARRAAHAGRSPRRPPCPRISSGSACRPGGAAATRSHRRPCRGSRASSRPPCSASPLPPARSGRGGRWRAWRRPRARTRARRRAAASPARPRRWASRRPPPACAPRQRLVGVVGAGGGGKLADVGEDARDDRADAEQRRERAHVDVQLEQLLANARADAERDAERREDDGGHRPDGPIDDEDADADVRVDRLVVRARVARRVDGARLVGRVRVVDLDKAEDRADDAARLDQAVHVLGPRVRHVEDVVEHVVRDGADRAEEAERLRGESRREVARAARARPWDGARARMTSCPHSPRATRSSSGGRRPIQTPNLRPSGRPGSRRLRVWRGRGAGGR